MKTCKVCKVKFEPFTNSLQRVCSIKCAIYISKQLTRKNDKAEMALRKIKIMSLQDYIIPCQKIFNSYIRERDKHLGCISCQRKLIEKGRKNKFDAGHYYNVGGHGILRFNEDNVHAQCVFCNQKKHGNLIPYRKRLIKKIGLERFEALEKSAEVYYKFTIDEVQGLTAKYKLMLKQLKSINND